MAREVMAKFNAVPPQALALDSMVKITRAEVRPAWQRGDGSMPENPVFLTLSSQELSVNLVLASARRGSGVLWLNCRILRYLWKIVAMDVYGLPANEQQ